MARVFVHGADTSGDRIERLQVKLGALPARVIDRATAIAWMRDMHSFVTTRNGKAGVALQLVEVVDGDEVVHFIRTDNAAVAADALPELPAVRA